VRVPVNGSTPVDAWLAGLHRQLTEVPAHEHCALAEVQRHSAVPGDRPLFETILVFNNERYGADLPAPLRRLPSPDAVGTGYPLVLDAMLADGLTLQLNYERSRYGAAAATRLLADAADMLRALAASGTASAAGGVASATPATLLAQLPALPLPAPPLPAPALPAPAVPAPPVAAPAVPDAHALAAPRSPREQTLAEIWAEVLGVARIGIHDNFFELGGDSIIAIQVVARARRAGLPIGPKQLFEHPTVARLCAVAARRQAQPVPVRADQGLVTGPVPLTPIQRWFTELDWPHDHYNQVSLLRAAQPLDPDLLDAALHRIVAHHDALRLRLTRPGAVGPDGRADRWRQHIAPDAGERGGPLLRRVDLSGLAPEQETAAMACAATAAHTSLDLAHGPLLRAVLFQGARRGAVAPADRLLVAVHHLAVDTVSWGILLEDLATAYRQLAAGTPVSLPAKTTSFQHWAYRLAEYAASERFADEAAFWRGTAPRVAALPTDRDGPHTEESTDLVSRTVPADVSATVRRGGAVRVEEALLTAMARAVKEWTGERAVGLDVERHGREPLFEDVDLLRTVGWFTAVQPLRLVLDSDDPAANLAMVAEHLRGVPHRGIGYGLTHPSTMEDAAQIVVNYHGQRAAGGAGGLFEPDPDPDPTPAGVDRAPAGIRPYLIEVDIATADGQLTVSWKYSRNRHSPGTIAALADSYLSHLRAVVTVGTPTTRDPVADRVFPGAPTLLLPAARRGLPGLSVAVVCDGALRRAFAHGTRDARHGDPLTPATLFQAGSASKQVTALGVLRLVDSGVLELDRDVNEYLTSWHPERPVTLRQLLSHRGGLSYHDYYRGYQRGGPLPTLREVLTGTGHSPNGPVRVERQPGSEYFYTGSHFSVIQQVLIDRTGEPFDALMRELVLEPLGMRDSGYGPGFAGADPSRVALGHGTTGVPYPGGWRNMAELAAAGLWTTPTDLALVAIEIQRASTGTGRLLGPEIGRQMTRQVQDSGYGLGVFVYQVAGRTRFGHGGETAGYKCLSTFDLERCAGMVIMTNGDTGREFLSEVHAELGLANAGAREGER
jgi:non-ribosomal peptide synthase protein (TIGR01720 family)